MERKKNETVEYNDQSEIFLGMTSKSEQQFYTECAREYCDSGGATVDLGSWLCSTAMSLARGMQLSGKNYCLNSSICTNKVFALDRFVWEDWMNRFLPFVSCDYQPGESFLPEVRRRIKLHREKINLVQADLTNYLWQHGPIKILLVDAMKSWQLCKSIAISFFPYLTENSLLIHQDFKHYYTPWIHILQYRLRNYFRVKYDVPDGGTLAFQVVSRIPAEILYDATRFEEIPSSEITDVFDYSMDLCGFPCGKAAIAAAHIMYFVHTQNADKASEMLELYSCKKIPKTDETGIVEELVMKMRV